MKAILIVLAVVVIVMVVLAHVLFFLTQGGANGGLDFGAYGRFLLRITGQDIEPFGGIQLPDVIDPADRSEEWHAEQAAKEKAPGE